MSFNSYCEFFHVLASQYDNIVKTELEPLMPLGPIYYDRSTHAIYGEKAMVYQQAQLVTPIYIDKGFSLAQEKELYMRFRMNIDPVAIRCLHGYYKACGLVDLNDRIARLEKLKTFNC